MKGDKLFMATIVTELAALCGIFIGYMVNLMSPVVGACIALISFIILCVGLILSMVVLFIYAFD